MRVWCKDEQHVSWLDDQPCVTSPDCLAIVETGRGEPLPNRSIDPRHFGFDLAYVPIVERLGYVMVEPLEHVYPGVPTGRCCIQRTPLPQGLAVLLDNYAALLRQTQRNTRAFTIQAQAKAIRARYAQQSAPQ